MRTSDFDYDLPVEYIAQTPTEPRDASRLMMLNRETGDITHAIFGDIGSYLNPEDLLVINETRVIPARIFAHKVPTGGRVEILLLRRLDAFTWEGLVGGRGLHAGKMLRIDEGIMVEIQAVLKGAERILRFSEPVEPYLKAIGHTPLPPYIHTPLQDPERYQTVYAAIEGSAAAPTAGLHFTNKLLENLQHCGIRIARVTLHVGLDTFAPVVEDDPREHIIHTEWCELTENTVDQIRRARQAGGRVIAVGTTSVRTLESAAQKATKDEIIIPYSGPTGLFILPGYQFKVVDAMITNFHLPRSTLLMLVSAFAGREKILEAYRVAQSEGYRFYSFGDAMFIL